MESIYDYTLDYYGNYVNDVLGTNNVITINYYGDLFAQDNNEYIIPDTVLTGYKNGNEFAFKVTLPDEIKREIFSDEDYENNKDKEITVPIKLIRVLFDSKYPNNPNGIDKPAGLYQYICADFDEDGDLERDPKYFILADADLPVFPEGYTAPAQMGLIESGDDIGNKTMKELFIAALGKDGWQDMPNFSYSTIKYLDSASANTGENFNSSYQIGTTLDIYGLTINYNSSNGKYLSTSEGTFTVPVIGSTDNSGKYTTNNLLSGEGNTYEITPTKGYKSGTITLKFSQPETYSFTKIDKQTIVSSITGTQSYIDPSNSEKKSINITGTTKSINVGQYPIYYAYLTKDPSANSTISDAEKISDKLQLQTSPLQNNTEFTVPVKNITEASYLYIFVSTLISTDTCTLSIINPDRTSASKLDKLAGDPVIISTGSTGNNYNKFYAFRVSNQTSGSAYSNCYIKYNTNTE